MPLNGRQVTQLDEAISRYAFPFVYFDFAKNAEVQATDMRTVEASIRGMLTSQDVELVRDGLANVLYWGYAQIAYGNVRVSRFRKNASLSQLAGFHKLVQVHEVPTLSQVLRVRMPEYSGISFISKILAFLDPGRYCVLDQQLAKLGKGSGDRALHRLSMGTRISVTSHNELAYDAWRAECAEISARYFGGRHRVVDVERGFFQLVQAQDLSLAQQIYSAA